jgi:hypothetical protein
MATAKVNRTGDRQPSRWKRNLALLALLAVVIVLAIFWDGLRQQARIATSYAAHAGCECRYVSQRPMESCEGDIAVAALGRTAGLLSLSDDADSKGVTASVPLLSSQTASFHRGRGCQLEPWTG